MINRLMQNNEQDLEIIKLCVEDSGRMTFNKENAIRFVNNQNNFFCVVFENEESTTPLGFAYGYILEMPENVTPTVFVYVLEVLKGTTTKGVGTFLMAQLRTMFFYEMPAASLFFLCDQSNNGLKTTILRSNGVLIPNLGAYFILNENLDANGQWKGQPKDGKVEIFFKDELD